jgi:hypothetical protein
MPSPRPQLGVLPQAHVRPFRGPRDTLAKMADHVLGDFGERSMLVRQFTEFVTRDVWPKSYLSEILAIRNVFVQLSPWRPGTPLFKYTNDPRHVELVKTPERMVREIRESGTTVVDCDEVASMAATMLCQVGRRVELVAMGFVPASLSHVAVRAEEPKTHQWILLDGIAGPREREAAGRVKELLTWNLD